MSILDPNRLFPTDPRTREIARALYLEIKDLPIISPHGHCDPSWFAQNERFSNPSALLITPDHYLFRMLVSQGVAMDKLGIKLKTGEQEKRDPREIWRLFAEHFYLFRGTPTAMWLNHSFQHVFKLDKPLTPQNADHYYDHIEACLSQEDFKPRALFERFNIEVLTTTEFALDPLTSHKAIRESGWQGRVTTSYRPDDIIDPENPNFVENIKQLGEITGEDTSNFQGYLRAHRARRIFFKTMGATASDHGHPNARTEVLAPDAAESLYQKVRTNESTLEDADIFRAHMLTEMARMSLEDGLVMQIHSGSWRNHSTQIYQRFGTDKGFDIPKRNDFVGGLKPLLDEVGMEPRLNIIVFTLDETAYGRELAPLAGAYPALKLGPPWWFFDSPEGIKRFREATTETCGFYNTVGFNDDTRAFCSIPARHDVSRRTDCAYLAELVATGRLSEDEAQEVAVDLTYNLPKKSYNF